MKYLTKSAVLSECGVYRYELRRAWDLDLPSLLWVMLNPSTADAASDDPTINRCAGFSAAWGYGGMTVANLYALRATDPGEVLIHDDPVGPENDTYLGRLADAHPVTVAAWGAHGRFRGRGAAVVDRLRRATTLYHLGLTTSRQPKHPLYLPAGTKLVRF